MRHTTITISYYNEPIRSTEPVVVPVVWVLPAATPVQLSMWGPCLPHPATQHQPSAPLTFRVPLPLMFGAMYNAGRQPCLATCKGFAHGSFSRSARQHCPTGSSC